MKNAAILILAFRPELNPTGLEMAVFAVAISGAFLATPSSVISLDNFEQYVAYLESLGIR